MISLTKSLYKRTSSCSHLKINFQSPQKFSSASNLSNDNSFGSVQSILESKLGGNFQPKPDLKLIEKRISLFESIHAQQTSQIKAMDHREIEIILPDGKILKGSSWDTTPLDIAKKISKKLIEKAVAAKVVYVKRDVGPFSTSSCDTDDCSVTMERGELYDLTRPLEGDCQLEIITFDDPIGKHVFWHSSAHLLGASMETLYGGHLCIGPALDKGFYYDIYLGDNKIHPSEFGTIEAQALKLVQEDYIFKKIYIPKSQAIELFQDNPFKKHLITHKIPDNAVTTAYRCGPLVDLCMGPHLPSLAKIKALKCTKTSGAYWLGKVTNDNLQRVYGISFPTQKLLDEHIKLQEEIAKRDHRNLGQQQELFFFSGMSPGSAFFYPQGTVVYNKLVQLIRNEYKIRGYQEVITPNIFNNTLWNTSGHSAKYKEDMFAFSVEEQEFAMKPMNCPGHCVMFKNIQRSYRELPVRFAEFGVLHRNEISGALSGLTRVRRFVQDDAHIFCRYDQIEEEIMGCLDFLKHIYQVFEFDFSLALSTKPANALGDNELWEKAETILAEALNKFGLPWKMNPGDGAFYGPKIDIRAYDALKREHQLGTIQLDFVLPERFNLQYRSDDQAHNNTKEEHEHSHENCSHDHDKHDHSHEDHKLRTGFQRPVMIHRAILGSLERMIAILTEHTAGKWPFWLSPRQVKVIPISDKYMDYAESVYHRLKYEGFAVELDRSHYTVSKKVRNAQVAQFNFIAVVGEEEANTSTIDLRERGNNERLGKFTITKLLDHFKSLEPQPSQASQKLRDKSLFSEEELLESGREEKYLQDLNNKLSLKMFLEDNLHPKAADEACYNKIKSVNLDKSKFPNVARWKSAMEEYNLEKKKANTN